MNTTASRLSTIHSLLGITLIILIGGALAGMGAALVGSFFYIVLVFPLAMGAAGGKIVGTTVRAARIKKASQLFFVSILTAMVIYGTFHYGRYIGLELQTLLILSSRRTASAGDVSLKAAAAIVNYALKTETGYSGFPGYMLYKAKTGISIGHFYDQDRLTLTSYLAWLYWLLEFGIIVWIARSFGEIQMRIPVCESCGRRYNREKHLGGTTSANEPLLLDLLARRDLIELGRLLEKDAGLPSVELYMRRCEACGQSSAHLTVRRAFLSAKGSVQLSDVSKSTMQPKDSALFLQQLQFEVD